MAGKSENDFRPMIKGDTGWWYKNHQRVAFVSKSKRWYVNDKTGEVIPLRQYQNLQRGATYTEYRKKQKAKGIEKKTYKKRKPSVPSKPVVAGYQKITPVISRLDRRKLNLVKNYEQAYERSQKLKESWARQRSKEYGATLTWDELPDEDKTAFWQYYHEIAYDGPPSYDQWEDEFQYYFDMSYDDWHNIPYGETP